VTIDHFDQLDVCAAIARYRNEAACPFLIRPNTA